MKTSWMRQVFSLELRRIMSYRVDFWLGLFVSLAVQLTIAYFLWSAIFKSRSTSNMAGYDFLALMLYYLLAPLTDRMIRGREGMETAQDIYEGSLSRYLTYPVSFFAYRYVSYLAAFLMNALQFVLAIAIFLIIFGVPEGASIRPATFVLGFFFILIAGSVYFFLAMAIEFIAFWADNVWSLMLALRFSIYFLGGGILPLSFFPKWYEPIAQYTPFSYFISFPLQLIMGRVAPEEFFGGVAIILIWGLIFFLGSAALWRIGCRSYTGPGI